MMNSHSGRIDGHSNSMFMGNISSLFEVIQQTPCSQGLTALLVLPLKFSVDFKFEDTALT